MSNKWTYVFAETIVWVIVILILSGAYGIAHYFNGK